jgi:glycosyltransferase involved in cell wall biosynthesis
MRDDELPARTRLGPPGVDVARFAPREPQAAWAGLTALRARLRARDGAPAARGPVAPAAGGAVAAAAAGAAAALAAGAGAAGGTGAAHDAAATAAPTGGSSFARRAGEAAAALDEIAPGDRLVVFVGKLIASKGVELLLAAWPLVLAREPRARLLVVGFGAFRGELERLARLLGAGELTEAASLRAEDGRELAHLRAFLTGPAAGDGYRAAARGVTQRVSWAGRLDHPELADLLPAAEAMAVPSTFPEAFGMVAAEAAACGALPVVARHSGLEEVARTLEPAVPPEVRALLAFDVGPGAVEGLADALAGWLAAPPDVRAATRAAIVAVTRERYSWDGVARTVIAAARGELAGLPEP